MRKQWVWEGAGAWRFMDGVTCDDMSGEVHIKLLSRGDTSEVRRAGLRAGRFVEAGPRAGSSPFLFVCGDDRVIRYTGADAVTRKQWVWEDAGAWRFMDGVTCDDMSGEVHIKLLSRGDTSEVRRAGLRAGRFVEAGPRAGSSPFLFVCGDDRVIRYTGADVDTGGAKDAQMAE
ncbi:hypothetical protein DEO72_LG5g1582 [Vigna unguiculata]|uniref:Uncharacterized protein n=1 Tax=Vigna unguiculata TaxID=3917 RepID=A0A4D6LXT6_VIGUN|nr:hypothetical protein DEO72_LG5g1582 [Vigna unguiculata]